MDCFSSNSSMVLGLATPDDSTASKIWRSD
jgi:hypothetical protein